MTGSYLQTDGSEKQYPLKNYIKNPLRIDYECIIFFVSFLE